MSTSDDHRIDDDKQNGGEKSQKSRRDFLKSSAVAAGAGDRKSVV